MMRAFSTSATGMMAQETLVDVIANNLANVNTTGFKRSQIEFQDLLYAKMKEPGTEVAPGVNAPTGLEVGTGVRVASTLRVFSLGEFENTQSQPGHRHPRATDSCRCSCRTATSATRATGPCRPTRTGSS